MQRGGGISEEAIGKLNKSGSSRHWFMVPSCMSYLLPSHMLMLAGACACASLSVTSELLVRVYKIACVKVG